MRQTTLCSPTSRSILSRTHSGPNHLLTLRMCTNGEAPLVSISERLRALAPLPLGDEMVGEACERDREQDEEHRRRDQRREVVVLRRELRSEERRVGKECR